MKGRPEGITASDDTLRVILHLKCEFGWSATRIANATNRSHVTVRTWLYIAEHRVAAEDLDPIRERSICLRTIGFTDRLQNSRKAVRINDDSSDDPDATEERVVPDDSQGGECDEWNP